MAKSQQNGITILLGLKGYQVGEVWEDDKGIVVQVTLGGEKLVVLIAARRDHMDMNYASQERYFTIGGMAKRFTLSFIITAWCVGIVGIPLPSGSRAGRWVDQATRKNRTERTPRLIPSGKGAPRLSCPDTSTGALEDTPRAACTM